MIDRTVPAAARQKFALGDDVGKLGGGAHDTPTIPVGGSGEEDGWEAHVGNKQQTRRGDELLPSSHGETQSKADVRWKRRQVGDQNFDKGDTRSSSTQALATNRIISSDNGRIAADNLLNTHPAPCRKHLIREIAGAARPELPLPTSVKQTWDLSKRHPLDTLRERGYGSANGGTKPSGGASMVDNAVIITKLKTSLRRAQEENARERERRHECEDQAKIAFLSLEAESKR